MIKSSFFHCINKWFFSIFSIKISMSKILWLF
nr:hypothetical protein CoNPh37_CDS0093 [Staphylococcus phage S-CoN_Ph37]